MSEYHVSRPPHGDQESRPGVVLAQSPSGSRASYETGESSTTGSLRNDAHLKNDRSHDPVTSENLALNSSSPASERGAHHDARPRRRQGQRSAGGFLLPDAVGADRDASHQRRARPLSQRKKGTVAPQQTRHLKEHIRQEDEQANAMDSLRATTTSPESSVSPFTTRNIAETSDNESDPSTFGQGSALPDAEASQIVNMALSLSESRRIASRRAVSQSNPPRLTPVPEASPGNNLRQHLQQQRRASHNISPKPPQASPRIPSASRINPPFQPSFLGGYDNSPQLQLSESTIARVQKAKEHLELMAEYRRLLEVLVPLKPGHDTSVLASPPPSPMNPTRFSQPNWRAHRQYNPLQYIRNRKVRARELKVIDGDLQGFGDVDNVRTWVQEIADRSASTSNVSARSERAMPKFPSAEEAAPKKSPDSTPRSAQRLRRPRVDWFFEPCDVIADAYWLEQKGHKYLIEDHEWRRIFPAPPDSARSLSRPVEEPLTNPPGTGPEPEEVPVDPTEAALTKTDTDLSRVSVKDRAKQKLQDIRGSHQKSQSLGHNHDILRMRRDSDSGLSEGDTDNKPEIRKLGRHGRSGTISGDSSDLLQRQMLEMLAKEAREKQLDNVPEAESEQHAPTSMVTPERATFSPVPNQQYSQKDSVTDASDPEQKAAAQEPRAPTSQPLFSRESFDIPEDHGRSSFDFDSSLPTSPELTASRDPSLIPIATGDFLPWSRPGSPTRNPLRKVKQILRDKGRDSGHGVQADETDDDKESPLRRRETTPSQDGAMSPDRRQASPPGRVGTRPTYQNHKSRRSTNSLRLRDDQAIGLRGMFKPPRIDTVIRGGVSKLGDIIWKRDGSGELSGEPDTTDESDSDGTRGRQRQPLPGPDAPDERDDIPAEPKHFLDTMPQFQHVTDNRKASGIDSQGLSRDVSRSQSRPSSRFDLLAPPPIKDGSASRSMSPSPTGRPRAGDSEASDSGSYGSNVPEGVRSADRRLSAVISGQEPEEGGRRMTRQWSIPDRGETSARTQLSKREVARLRALILSSGIKAMEINRRASKPIQPFKGGVAGPDEILIPWNSSRIAWSDIAKLTPNEAELREQRVPHNQVYPLAARSLAMAVQTSTQRWRVSADRFTAKTSLDLQRRIWSARTRVADDLSTMTRMAADEADETNHDLALGQPLKVKHVVDVIEKMLRRRRRRLRWVRRATWLTVEWLLVGFMWYVWFVVTILRVFLGVGRGIWTGVRWLLWL